ncbi:MAG: glycosyltransferase family 4 protein [Bacteroidaceae bacterium]
MGNDKEKLAFVVVRYGNDINGGAEYHCKMLAERLVDDYDVEVLTTCVKNYMTGTNEAPEGEEIINKVLVRKFPANPVHKEQNKQFMKEAASAKRWRRFLYKCRLLNLISAIFPIWNYKREAEINAQNSQVFYSSKLFSFIKGNKNNYKAFISISLDYPPMYYTALYAPEKTIIIPTMHYHGAAFRSILTSVFTKVAYIGFNTTAEQKLGRNIFGNKIASNGIISVGIEKPEAAEWDETLNKYHLPEEYLLYAGRVDDGKLNCIIDYFLAYKREYKSSALKFVLMGGVFGKTVSHPDVQYTGFVSDSEKMAIIQHSKIVVNPSKYESLSLILLEAMSQCRPLLVNGHCSVLKEHCQKSDYAALYYMSKHDFISKLYQLDTSDEQRVRMGEKGCKYVEKNYDWSVIMGRLKRVIENIKS